MLEVLDGDAYEKVVFPGEWKGQSYDFNDSLVATAVCFEVGRSFREWLTGHLTPATLDEAQKELLRLVDETVTRWRNKPPDPEKSNKNPWKNINFDTVKQLAEGTVNSLTEKGLNDFKEWHWMMLASEDETPHSHVQDIQNPKSISDFQHVEPMESLGVWLKDHGCTIC